ncbi:MAG: hypothetical protein WCD49_00805 [Candidatus Acidiferrales bacterium]
MSNQLTKTKTGSVRKLQVVILVRVLALAAITLATTVAQSSAALQSSASQQAQSSPASGSSSTAPLPRGKKLMLKDGTFQLVREYHMEGDRVRYYSIEQSQWEEMPESLVDWDATKKVEAEQAKHDAELVAKLHAREAGRTAQALDIDASLEVAPGVFLPPGEGIFAFDGKSVAKIPQAPADIKFSKKQMLKQVLVPIPIIPSRHTISLIGAHAKLRIVSAQTEFYMRTADGREPELELLRAKIKGDERYLENLDELFKEQGTTGQTTVLMQRWLIAPGVYRFTLEQHMDPGEYALAEIVQGGGTNLYFWDFGLDAGPAEAPVKASK